MRRRSLRRREVDALKIKPGPTESGEHNTHVVGGEISSLTAIAPLHLVLILVVLIPLAILLYKKRNIMLPLILRTLIR